MKLTENAQPAILTTSIAMLRVLETEFGFDIFKACNHALGHSLGEYTALVATKAMSLTDAVRLVRLRGEAMTKAVGDKQGKTSMSALVVRKDKLADLQAAVEEIKADLPRDEILQIANINSVWGKYNLSKNVYRRMLIHVLYSLSKLSSVELVQLLIKHPVFYKSVDLLLVLLTCLYRK